jgi:hypothetical protein
MTCSPGNQNESYEKMKREGVIDRMKKLLALIGLLLVVSFGSAAGLTVSVSDTTGAPGDTVEVPINLEGASNVGSMDIVLTYDSNVLRAVAVEAGKLAKTALIESNTAEGGGIIIALADSSGITGDGEVATISFEVLGDSGTTSPLTLESVSVSNTELVELVATTESGTFSVEKPRLGDASTLILAIAALIIALFVIERKK